MPRTARKQAFLPYLAGSENIQSVHLAEALHLRSSEVDDGMNSNAKIYLINKQAPPCTIIVKRYFFVLHDQSSQSQRPSTRICEVKQIEGRVVCYFLSSKLPKNLVDEKSNQGRV